MKATLSQKHLDLLQLVVPHIVEVGLDEAEFYTRNENRGKVPGALRRGFALPSAIVPNAVPVPLVGYPAVETDCFIWLGHMEKFAKQHFGVDVNLCQRAPMFLPWQQVLPIFDPGLTDREMIDKALKARGVQVYEEKDVMQFTGAQSSGPRLGFIERSLGPTEATMGLSPKFLKNWYAGRQTRPLDRRAYGIAASLFHKVEKKFLDPQTFTWFPENTLPLPGGEVARGSWCGVGVGFYCNDPDCEGDCGGSREVIWVPLKSQPSIP